MLSVVVIMIYSTFFSAANYSSVILLIRVHAIWYNKRIILVILLATFIVGIFYSISRKWNFDIQPTALHIGCILLYTASHKWCNNLWVFQLFIPTLKLDHFPALAPTLLPSGCLVAFKNRNFWIGYTMLLFLETCENSLSCYIMYAQEVTVLVMIILISLKSFLSSKRYTLYTIWNMNLQSGRISRSIMDPQDDFERWWEHFAHSLTRSITTNNL